ncbi:MAG: hypothetical protein HFJ28_02040 [Clostridia bacterium]|jgi:hypothetical protein|nr:hypothetical protein [Clostridia bacterium]
MNSCEIVNLVSILSCTIAQNRTTEEIELLSVIFTQLGDSLATIATVRTTNTQKKQKC